MPDNEQASGFQRFEEPGQLQWKKLSNWAVQFSYCVWFIVICNLEIQSNIKQQVILSNINLKLIKLITQLINYLVQLILSNLQVIRCQILGIIRSIVEFATICSLVFFSITVRIVIFIVDGYVDFDIIDTSTSSTNIVVIMQKDAYSYVYWKLVSIQLLCLLPSVKQKAQD
eukprot:TRINITY_DN636_c1_g2_i2.p2 TRINITY_DN636_c1_g2~~TRINITY_DN636_c1_g2_i2.p2  ORF type:complete len:171 (-),score=0.85 TRINITY_DN636_c1_g2_i2:23-535(-)